MAKLNSKFTKIYQILKDNVLKNSVSLAHHVWIAVKKFLLYVAIPSFTGSQMLIAQIEVVYRDKIDIIMLRLLDQYKNSMNSIEDIREPILTAWRENPTYFHTVNVYKNNIICPLQHQGIEVNKSLTQAFDSLNELMIYFVDYTPIKTGSLSEFFSTLIKTLYDLLVFIFLSNNFLAVFTFFILMWLLFFFFVFVLLAVARLALFLNIKYQRFIKLSVYVKKNYPKIVFWWNFLYSPGMVIGSLSFLLGIIIAWIKFMPHIILILITVGTLLNTLQSELTFHIAALNTISDSLSPFWKVYVISISDNTILKQLCVWLNICFRASRNISIIFSGLTGIWELSTPYVELTRLRFSYRTLLVALTRDIAVMFDLSQQVSLILAVFLITFMKIFLINVIKQSVRNLLSNKFK